MAAMAATDHLVDKNRTAHAVATHLQRIEQDLDRSGLIVVLQSSVRGKNGCVGEITHDKQIESLAPDTSLPIDGRTGIPGDSSLVKERECGRRQSNDSFLRIGGAVGLADVVEERTTAHGAQHVGTGQSGRHRASLPRMDGRRVARPGVFFPGASRQHRAGRTTGANKTPPRRRLEPLRLPMWAG